MLQASTNDRKTKAETSSKTAEPLAEQESQAHLPSWMGRFSKREASPTRQSQPLQQRENLAALQKVYGNQAVLRMSRGENGRSPTQGGVLQRKHNLSSQSETTNQTARSDTLSVAQEEQNSSFYHDFSCVRVDPTTPRPRIEPSAISFHRLSTDAVHDMASHADGSLEELEDDRDSLVPSVFERGSRGRGVHINVLGGNPTGTPDFPDGIRWIQTIDTNAPLFGQSPPYVDFIPPRDNKPFYFIDAMEASQGGRFSDNPSRRANGVRWDATLSLVGVAGRNVTRLDSVDYGFDLDASGTLTLHRPSKTSITDVVVQGDTLRSEHSDWFFGGGFAVPQVPAGGATDETGMA